MVSVFDHFVGLALKELKHQKPRFPYVFRGYRKKAVAWKLRPLHKFCGIAKYREKCLALALVDIGRLSQHKDSQHNTNILTTLTIAGSYVSFSKFF